MARYSAGLYLLGIGLIWTSVAAGPKLIRLLSARPEALARALVPVVTVLGGEAGRTLAFTIGYGLMWAVYVLTLPSREGAGATRWDWLWPCLFVLTLLPLPLYFSEDLIGYAQRGRVLSRYGANPYLHTIWEFSDGWAQYYTYWKGQPSPYGPAALLLFVGATWLAGERLWVAVGLLKLVMAGCYLISGWMVYRVVQRTTPQAAREALFFFLWNPLILLELVGQGHADAVMIAPMTVAFYWFSRQRGVDAAFWMTLSTLTKIATGVLLPGLAVFLWRRRELRTLTRAAAVGGALLIASGLVFFRDFRSFAGFRATSQLLWMSPMWVGVEALSALGVEADVAHRALQTLLMVAFMGFLLWRLTKIHTELDVFRESAVLIIWFLLAVAGQVPPWYLTLTVPLAAVSGSRRIRAAVMTLSLWPLLYYFRPWFLGVHYWPNVARTLALYVGVVATVWRTPATARSDDRA